VSTTVLKIDHASASYGPVAALKDVSLALEAGEIVAVLGANGAGKTTLVRSIAGLVRLDSGSISGPGGVALSRLPAHRISRMGVAVVPEGAGAFTGLSVEDNLSLGIAARRVRRKEWASRLEKVYQRFPILAQRRNQKAGTLSGGERQMLGIAKALMVDCRILVLDEPSLGLAPRITTEVLGVVSALATDGIGVVLVEQNARRALNVSHRAIVLDRGRVIKSDESARLREDPDLESLYLGGAVHLEEG
jgi:ABC-type branched-subunit amino acid transport system ATPase component